MRSRTTPDTPSAYRRNAASQLDCPPPFRALSLHGAKRGSREGLWNSAARLPTSHACSRQPLTAVAAPSLAGGQPRQRFCFFAAPGPCPPGSALPGRHAKRRASDHDEQARRRHPAVLPGAGLLGGRPRGVPAACRGARRRRAGWSSCRWSRCAPGTRPPPSALSARPPGDVQSCVRGRYARCECWRLPHRLGASASHVLSLLSPKISCICRNRKGNGGSC